MSYKAFEVLDEAVQSTKDLLLPFDRGTWLRLAVIVVFTGGGMNFPSVPSGFGDTGATSDYSNDYGSTLERNAGVDTVTGAFSSAEASMLVIGIAVIVGVIGLLLYLTSVFQFVYYRSLVDENVRIRPNIKKHARDGLQLMALRLAIMFSVILLVIGVGATLFTSPGLGILAVLGLIPVLVLVAIASGLVNNLVIPEMIKESKGILESIKDVYGDVRSEWREVVVYILLRFGARVAIGIASMIVLIPLILIIVLVFGIPAILLYTSSLAAAIIFVFAGILVAVAAMILVMVPFRTFMYFYALRFYERL